jgi:hypothetical protein
VPQVRPSVPGPKTMGRSPTIAFAESRKIGLWVAKAFNRIYRLLLRHRILRDCSVSEISPPDSAEWQPIL